MGRGPPVQPRIGLARIPFDRTPQTSKISIKLHPHRRLDDSASEGAEKPPGRAEQSSGLAQQLLWQESTYQPGKTSKITYPCSLHSVDPRFYLSTSWDGCCSTSPSIPWKGRRTKPSAGIPAIIIPSTQHNNQGTRSNAPTARLSQSSAHPIADPSHPDRS